MGRCRRGPLLGPLPGLLLALQLCLLGALPGCPTPPPADGALPDRPCPEGSFLTWETFGQAFVNEHCTGCHSSGLDEGARADAPLELDFDTQADVWAHLSAIYYASGDENSVMPPVDDLDAETRWLLGDWLACGAP